MELREYLF